MKGAEQAEVLPAGSVAVAENSEVVLSSTPPARPGEAKSAAEPWDSGGPEQSAALVERHGGAGGGGALKQWEIVARGAARDRGGDGRGGGGARVLDVGEGRRAGGGVAGGVGGGGRELGGGVVVDAAGEAG